MILILTVLHVMSAVLLIISILLQPGRSTGFSVTFSETATAIFGGKGATSFLEKFTAGAAAVFVATALILAMRLGKGGGGSVMKDVSEPPAATVPETAPLLPGEVGGGPVESSPSAEPSAAAPPDAPAPSESAPLLPPPPQE